MALEDRLLEGRLLITNLSPPLSSPPGDGGGCVSPDIDSTAAVVTSTAVVMDVGVPASTGVEAVVGDWIASVVIGASGSVVAVAGGTSSICDGLSIGCEELLGVFIVL